MVPAIALLAVEHLPRLLATAALDAALALGTLPVVVAYPCDHSLWHFNAAGMYCRDKEREFIYFYRLRISLTRFLVFLLHATSMQLQFSFLK